MKIDSNDVQNMVMNERYIYEVLGNHDVEIFEQVETVNMSSLPQ